VGYDIGEDGVEYLVVEVEIFECVWVGLFECCEYYG